MEVYQIDEDKLTRVPASELSTEQELEEHLIKSRGAVIGDVELFYIDRQGTHGKGGIFDILAVDRNGDLVIVELKRDKTPRDIVAQALEYASSLRNETYNELNDRYRNFVRTQAPRQDGKEEIHSLQAAHDKYFDINDDSVPKRVFNTDQRLMLVGTKFRTVSLNMADFLRDHNIDVVCVEYEAFASDGGVQLLTTQCIRRPLSAEPTGTSSDDSETESGRTKREFWESVNEEIASRAETPLTPVNSTTYYAQNQSTPLSDVKIRLTVNTREQRISVFLLIRNDKELFDRFRTNRETIEAELDAELDWVSPDQTHSDSERCKIRLSRSVDLDERGDWDEAVRWMVNQAEQFDAIFANRLASNG